MNGFSDLLSKAIQASGCTIYQLSKLSGVSRTSVQRALKEERVLRPESFRRLLPCLRLSAGELERLSDSYEELYYGRAVFSRRRYVKEILESIPEGEMVNGPGQEDFGAGNGLDFGAAPQGKCLFTGHSEVAQLLRFLAGPGRDNGEILLFLSTVSPFSRIVLRALIGGGNKVRHLIPLIKDPGAWDDALYNLKCFGSVFPYMFDFNLNYWVYYDYTAQGAESDANAYFPYFVVFSRAFVLLSPNLKTAWYVDTDGIVRHYRESFNKRLERCRRLSISSGDYFSMGCNMIYQDSQAESLSWLEFQPCFIPMCTESLTERALSGISNKQEILELMRRRSRQMRGIQEKIGFFQRDSIMDFVQRGQLLNLPERLVRPLDVRDRLFLLEELYHICQEDQELVRAIVPGALSVPENVTVALHGGRSFIISRFHKDTDLYDILEVEEDTLGQAFWDFMSHGVETPMVYSKKDTLKIIWDGILALKRIHKT